jgi:ACS family sodium-dependent inorganic phosphate cotransporter-like MFS transporter 5
MHALLARWAPPLERSKLGAFVYAGTQIGTVLAMPLSGYLISTDILGGWPSVFYVFGVMGIVWFVFWSIYVFDSPANHPRIEPRELSYIQHSIGSQGNKVRPLGLKCFFM